MAIITSNIGKIFALLEAYEILKFIPEQEQFIKSSIKIQDENSNWVTINAAITKKDKGIKLDFSDGSVIKCAEKHKIFKHHECVYADKLSIGDMITKANGDVISVTGISEISDELFYDFSVDTNTHLYQTSNGIIHHNTELAVQLGKTLSQPLIRFDMSEYQEQHKVASLIGAPPGYAGYGDGQSGSGKLINEIEKNPNCVLLLDEVEKAHPSVLNVFLQLMDNGIVTGSDGKSVNARNIVLIMTSNLGAEDAEKNIIGFNAGKNQGSTEVALKKFFAPEFRNRLDAIVKFNKLSKENIEFIVEKFIDEINTLLTPRNIKISLDPSATKWLIDNGYNDSMGARPMKRLINQEIKQPLSKKILFDPTFDASSVVISRVADEWAYGTVPR